jgi:hypothetical protein
VAVAAPVQPLYLVDFLFDFKTLEIIKFRLVALKFHIKFILRGLRILLFTLGRIFILNEGE